MAIPAGNTEEHRMGFGLTLSHVGIFVSDLSRMTDFYARFLGFAVSDRDQWNGGEIVFLTRDPREHHQFVLATGRPPDLTFNPINQLSFRVDSLSTLRSLWRGLAAEGLTDLGPLTHGNAISVYLRDPEDNRVELLIDTPWHVPQPHRHPIDLSKPDAEVWAEVERHVRATPGCVPRETWRSGIEQRIAEATAQREPTLPR
jgi:catechol 2,3-dioxygenase-like lactoylglutathione lyase family enzyme